MKDKKMLAYPTYDGKSEKWIIEVETDDGVVPIGKTLDKEIGIFKICEYDTREDAIEWLDRHKDNFVY